jgi:hypothetical protein
MAFTDQESAISPRVLWAITGGIAIILLGVAMVKTEFIDWALDQMRTPSQVEGELMGKPKTAAMLKAIKANYPDQHKKMIQDYSDAVRRGNVPEYEEINLINEYYAFLNAKSTLAPNASEATLLEIAKLRYEIADELRKGDRDLCNKVYYGQAEPFEIDNKIISAGYAQVDYLTFKAAREAEANPIPRDIEQNRQVDGEAVLEKAFSLGLKKETETIGNMIYTRAAGEECDKRYYFFKAALAMPKEKLVLISARTTAP